MESKEVSLLGLLGLAPWAVIRVLTGMQMLLMSMVVINSPFSYEFDFSLWVGLAALSGLSAFLAATGLVTLGPAKVWRSMVVDPVSWVLILSVSSLFLALTFSVFVFFLVLL